MFPWVYEFHWTFGHILFLAIFFSALFLLGSTFLWAVLKTYRNSRNQSQLERILWKAQFEDLSKEARSCRHELTGEIEHRQCQLAFDCRECQDHSKFLAAESSRWKQIKPTGTDLPFGLTMPSDRRYHRGHTWVKKESNGLYTIGLDDFGSHLLGEPEETDLPEVGSHLQVNGRGWNLKKKGAWIPILSPMDGEVVERGGSKLGWYLKIKAAESENQLTHLLGASEVKPWLMREIERLQICLATDGIGVSLADGGELMQDLTQQEPRADWDGVLGEMFLRA